MKKILSYILITVIIAANLFAPISVGWKTNNPKIQQNKVEAASNIQLSTATVSTDTSIQVTFYVLWGEKKISDKSHVTISLYEADKTTIKDNQTVLTKSLTDENFSSNLKQNGIVTFDKNLAADTPYFIKATATQVNTDGKTIAYTTPDFGLAKTGKTGKTTPKFQGAQTGSSKIDTSYIPSCSLFPGYFSLSGCIAQALYYGLFIPTSYLFALSGKFFDNTFYYSVQSSSYQSPFVVQGWSLVRDFVNMFFIFVLLYIAFSTILNLNGAKTKEMIINVIIIGLLINFSLFAARLVVDTSNILARVFYNSNTIKITEVKGLDASKTIAKPNKNGVIPLSAALVNKVNPQSLIINAKRVGEIPDKAKQGTSNNEKNKNGVTTGTFILVTLLAAGVSVVGFIVFLTVGLMFIVRVVGLWLAMILAPIAFFSYTIPAMQNIEMVGWKKWWPNLLKLAFLAPIFVFFIYLILQFLNAGMGIMDPTKTGSLSFVLRTIIPFAFIMILLLKAKDIAVKMSGEMGQAVSKAGSAVSGLALGAATGGAAMAMRGTVGKLGGKLNNATWVNKMAGSKSLFNKFAGNKLKDVGQFVGKKSFDIRNTKLGAEAGKGLGVDLGKAKEGGYAQAKEDKVKRQQERAGELEVGEDSKLKQDLNKKEMDLQTVLNAVADDFERIDEELKKERQNKKDGDPGAEAKIEALKKSKKKIKEADGSPASITGTDIHASAAEAAVLIHTPGTAAHTAAQVKALNARAVANAAEAAGKVGGRSIKQRENEDIPMAKNKINKENRDRRVSFAKNLQTRWSKANREAQHRIIMNSKIDSGKDE